MLHNAINLSYHIFFDDNPLVINVRIHPLTYSHNMHNNDKYIRNMYKVGDVGNWRFGPERRHYSYVISFSITYMSPTRRRGRYNVLIVHFLDFPRTPLTVNRFSNFIVNRVFGRAKLIVIFLVKPRWVYFTRRTWYI